MDGSIKQSIQSDEIGNWCEEFCAVQSRICRWIEIQIQNYEREREEDRETEMKMGASCEPKRVCVCVLRSEGIFGIVATLACNLQVERCTAHNTRDF